MHDHKTKKLKITIVSPKEGRSVEAVVEVPADAEIAVSELAKERSPLHPKALTADELEVGMNVQLWSNHYGILRRGMIKGKPYRISDPDSVTHGAWVVPVVAMYEGIQVPGVWHLADMGAAPYEGGRWNDQNYTLAVS